MRSLERQLREGLTELSLVLDDAQIAGLLDYLALIGKWTQVYNLTSIRNPADMLSHHLMDSLAVIKPLHAQLTRLCSSGPEGGVSPATRLLDVGSGAGLPGVVIAICCPDLMVDCVDAVAKKAAFVRQVAVTLKLSRLRGLHARVERLTDKYDIICSRAFATLGDFAHGSSAALADGSGIWLAMKGKKPSEEMAALPPEVEVFHVEQLQVPGLGAERCLIWMRRRPD